MALMLTGPTILLIETGKRAQEDLKAVQPGVHAIELFFNLLVDCVIWAFLTIFIVWLGEKFPLEKGRWVRSLLVHVGACLVCGIVHTALVVIACEYIRFDIPKPTVTANVLFFFFVAKLNNNIFFYWAILAVCQIANYYRQLRDRELRSSQLEAKLAQTQTANPENAAASAFPVQYPARHLGVDSPGRRAGRSHDCSSWRFAEDHAGKRQPSGSVVAA